MTLISAWLKAFVPLWVNVVCVHVFIKAKAGVKHHSGVNLFRWILSAHTYVWQKSCVLSNNKNAFNMTFLNPLLWMYYPTNHKWMVSGCFSVGMTHGSTHFFFSNIFSECPKQYESEFYLRKDICPGLLVLCSPIPIHAKCQSVLDLSLMRRGCCPSWHHATFQKPSSHYSFRYTHNCHFALVVNRYHCCIFFKRWSWCWLNFLVHPEAFFNAIQQLSLNIYIIKYMFEKT